jgi:hypothetical protein
LLSGLTERPYIPICVLVAFTTPITFYLYDKFAKQWAGPALPASNAKPAIAKRPAIILLVVGIALGLTTILGPQLLIPYCTPEATTPTPIQRAGAKVTATMAQSVAAGQQAGQRSVLDTLLSTARSGLSADADL